MKALVFEEPRTAVVRELDVPAIVADEVLVRSRNVGICHSDFELYEGRYIIPIDHFRIKYVGSPTLTLRYITGSAGVGKLPALEQNVGARLALSFLRVDYLIDPASRRSNFSVGLSVFR